MIDMNVLNKTYNELYRTGCSDDDADRLVDQILKVNKILGADAAKAVAEHITSINPDYSFSDNPRILRRQIEDWWKGDA